MLSTTVVDGVNGIDVDVLSKMVMLVHSVSKVVAEVATVVNSFVNSEDFAVVGLSVIKAIDES